MLALVVAATGVLLFACIRREQRHGTYWPVVSFATVKPVLESLANELPPELKKNSESKWNAWTRQEDDLVRARLEQGGLDSMVNVL
jgi:hypothetical protein